MTGTIPAASPDLVIVVGHTPAPGGSKKSFVPVNRKTGEPLRSKTTGRIIVNTVDDAKGNKDWRGAVFTAAITAMHEDGGTFPLGGPIEMSICFTVPRPKTVPKDRLGYPIIRPDLTKYLRSTEDALKDAGAFGDDAQIWRFRDMAKVYLGSRYEMALPHVGALIYLWMTRRPLDAGEVVTEVKEGVLW